MKTIFITGGSTGIGAASVRKFLAEGWNVGFMDLNTLAAGKLADELNGTILDGMNMKDIAEEKNILDGMNMKDIAEEKNILDGMNMNNISDGKDLSVSKNFSERLLFVKGDTRNREDIRRAVTTISEHFGGIDSIFANAGIHRSNTLLDISDEELDLMIQTNIYGTVNTLREAVPELIRRGGGTVVINASDQWFIGKAHSFAYGLTKGALGQITRSLSIDLGPHNIRVNAVCAGTIATPLVDNLFEKYSKAHGCTVEDCWREENSLYARGRVGAPEEVANLVYFLASDASSFCTGGHYLVDGGLVAK